MHAQAATAMYDHGHNGRIVDTRAGEAERTWGLFNHLVGLLSLGEVPLLGLIGAIVMWRIKHRNSPFLDDHGREAVNFQITLLLYTAVFFAFAAITFGVVMVLFPLFVAAMAVLRLVGCIRGAIAANRGELYRYPMCLRFLK